MKRAVYLVEEFAGQSEACRSHRIQKLEEMIVNLGWAGEDGSCLRLRWRVGLGDDGT